MTAGEEGSEMIELTLSHVSLTGDPNNHPVAYSRSRSPTLKRALVGSEGLSDIIDILKYRQLLRSNIVVVGTQPVV